MAERLMENLERVAETAERLVRIFERVNMIGSMGHGSRLLGSHSEQL